MTRIRSILFLLLIAGLLVLPGCRRAKAVYDQSSPQAVVASAQKMVETGDVRRLSDLIQADTAEMRAIWSRVGLLLNDVKDLAAAINKAFPEEVAKLKAEAKAAAESGKAPGLLAQITGGQRNRRQGRPSPGSDPMADPRTALNDSLRLVLADPFAWLDANSGRLTTVPMNDEMAALMWDGKPIFPPVGLVLQQSSRDDKWYLVLPTHVPPVSRIMPRTPEEHAVWGKLIDSIRGVVIDLRKDVESGKLSNLEQVSRAAGERAFIPMAFIGVAYSKMMEDRRAAERAAREARAAEQRQAAPAPQGG